MKHDFIENIEQYIQYIVILEIGKLKKELLEYIDKSIKYENTIDKISFEELIQLHNN